MGYLKERMFFVESSLDSVDCIFWIRYGRHFKKHERLIVKRLMLRRGVFALQSAMDFCAELFDNPSDAIFNIGVVCRVRPE